MSKGKKPNTNKMSEQSQNNGPYTVMLDLCHFETYQFESGNKLHGGIVILLLLIVLIVLLAC